MSREIRVSDIIALRFKNGFARNPVLQSCQECYEICFLIFSQANIKAIIVKLNHGW
ncbi:MAG: hypothetical protein ABIO31_13740 [Candidatus Nitrotoga sp.]